VAPSRTRTGQVAAATGEHPLHGLVDWNFDVERPDAVGAGVRENLLERLSLGRSPREAVQEEAVLDHVGLGEAIDDDPDHHVVGDQVAGVNQGARPQAQFGALGDGGAQHVAGGDVDRSVGLDEAHALRALAGALAAQDDEADGCHAGRALQLDGYLRKPS
jgi:hypothetical protein